MKISISFFLLFFTIIYGRTRGQPPFSQFSGTNSEGFRSNIPIPFPQCFTTESAAQILQPQMVQRLFDAKLTEEDRKFTQERNRNINLNNGRRRIFLPLSFNDLFSISMQMTSWISKKCNYELIRTMVLYSLEQQLKSPKKFFFSMEMNDRSTSLRLYF